MATQDKPRGIATGGGAGSGDRILFIRYSLKKLKKSKKFWRNYEKYEKVRSPFSDINV
jgi:hypothetical protein